MKILRNIENWGLKSATAFKVSNLHAACGGTGTGLTGLVLKTLRDYLDKQSKCVPWSICRCFWIPGWLFKDVSTIGIQQNAITTLEKLWAKWWSICFCLGSAEKVFPFFSDEFLHDFVRLSITNQPVIPSLGQHVDWVLPIIISSYQLLTVLTVGILHSCIIVVKYDSSWVL